MDLGDHFFGESSAEVVPALKECIRSANFVDTAILATAASENVGQKTTIKTEVLKSPVKTMAIKAENAHGNANGRW